MNHEELISRMRNLYQNKQYLEAFLLQSTYIEELITICAQFNFIGVVYPVMVNDSNEIVIKEIEKKIGNLSAVQKIDFIVKAGFFDKTIASRLNNYRTKRNEVVHGLVRQIKKGDFEFNLKETYEEGARIINENSFAEVVFLVQRGIDGFGNEAESVFGPEISFI